MENEPEIRSGKDDYTPFGVSEGWVGSKLTVADRMALRRKTLKMDCKEN